jgi:pimeloyl-ACP methyl ester carboxylesterase
MPSKNFVIKNRQEKRIQATLRTPENKPKGTVVLLHGLGGWKEQPLLVIVAEALAKHGFNVLTFDAADGAKGPDGDFTKGTTTGYVEDFLDVVDHLETLDWYETPMIVAGHSMGGLVALHYARLHPAKVSKLVLLAPAVSWKYGLPFTLPLGLWWLVRNKNKTPGPDRKKLPLDRGWLIDFMKFDTKRDAPYVSAPTLIVSASKDGTVADPKAHFSLAQRFTNALCTVIPGANHIFWKHEKQVADTITQWLT